ncbi:FKBP-type peptidyl-prolyl cis-trans isomerase [Solitalea koreensis]|uniref:Peptidyl-prolyl cis-trans isomerase n=1 Tax=Solitalea koreensis TaxID=543615 RepID=A0A521ALZ8_9SPHI|nr:FKBP-type peptidyl-prolyl cis-trans isomerase [Solitalea koreensis]SMO35801.1 FKBP-type peptidyl-prolyl cis-trans isomerase [Solitalea koreensis]
MKKLLLAAVIGTGLLVSMCSTQDTQNVYCISQYSAKADSADRQAIRAFVVRKAMDSVYTTASGLSYRIYNAGNPNRKPSARSKVGVDYTGALISTVDSLSDKQFDHGTHINFTLNNVIKGWTEGLQLIGEGGRIRLMIPSYMAYGDCGNGTAVPSNIPLVFDIKLVQLY